MTKKLIEYEVVVERELVITYRAKVTVRAEENAPYEYVDELAIAAAKRQGLDAWKEVHRDVGNYTVPEL